MLFIAIAGAMEGMLKIENSTLSIGKSMLVVLCLAIGTIIGELLEIEKGFQKFGEWLKKKTGNLKKVILHFSCPESGRRVHVCHAHTVKSQSSNGERTKLLKRQSKFTNNFTDKRKQTYSD